MPNPKVFFFFTIIPYRVTFILRNSCIPKEELFVTEVENTIRIPCPAPVPGQAAKNSTTMRKLLLLSLLLYCTSLFSQTYTVKFLIQQPAPYQDKVYLAGSFNDWNPGDNNYQVQPLDATHFFVDLKVPAGRYEYKFTRGVWSTVEGAATGLDISNRSIEVRRDTTVNIKIEGWMDKFTDFINLPDSTKFYVAYSRSFFYLDTNLDSSYKYAQQANALLAKVDNKKYEGDMARILGRIMQRQGNHERALEYYLKQLAITQQMKDTLSMAFCLLDIGHLFLGTKDYANAKNYYLQVRSFDPFKTESFGRSAPNLALVGIGRVYYNTNQLDSARYYALQAYEVSLRLIDRPTQSEALTLLGNILETEKRRTEAIKYYQLAIRQAQIFSNPSIIAENNQYIARAFYADGQLDSSLNYARKAFVLASELKNPYTIMEAGNLLVSLFKNTGQKDSALTYLETIVAAKDSLLSQNKNQQLQTIMFNEELQKQQNKEAGEKLQSEVKIYMAAGIALLLLLSIFLWWNTKRKRQVSALLNEQKAKVQKTGAELEAARSQLLQKEQMVKDFALGIAHEIQEPLHSVNKIAATNIDTAKKLKGELAAANIPFDQMQNLNTMTDELVKNQQKIMEQGRRAGVIVEDLLEQTGNVKEQDSLLM